MLPPGSFEAIVPALILLGVVLVILQPRLSRGGRGPGGGPRGSRRSHRRRRRLVGVARGAGDRRLRGLLRAAQGVLLMAVLGIGVNELLQRLNGVKNVLAAAR